MINFPIGISLCAEAVYKDVILVLILFGLEVRIQSSCLVSSFVCLLHLVKHAKVAFTIQLLPLVEALKVFSDALIFELCFFSQSCLDWRVSLLSY